jgi:uncharacterized membrane protein
MPERYVGFHGWLLLLAACTSARHPSPAVDSAALSVVKARGNEPFWSVEVSQAAGVIYRTPEMPAGISLPYEEPEKTPTGRAWYAKGAGHTLDLLVNEVPCTDTMSGEKFARSAVVIFDGARHEGCAGSPLTRPS